MDEQEESSEQLTAQVKAGLAIVAVGAIWYAVTTRKERKKRKEIQNWKVMNLTAIAASSKRLKDLLDSPMITEDEFWTAWREEQEFLKLIHDQPMY